MYLLSAGADATLKIWDLRQGHILYTLYGHERAATSVKFSDSGEYFISGGVDTKVIVWKSNLEKEEEENLIEQPKKNSQSRVDRAQSRGEIEVKRPGSANKPAGEAFSRKTPSVTDGFIENVEVQKYQVRKTPSVCEEIKENIERPQTKSAYRGKNEEIPEEVTATIDKIVGQLDIVTKTLMLLEQRVTKFEDHVMMLSDTIAKKSINK